MNDSNEQIRANSDSTSSLGSLGSVRNSHTDDEEEERENESALYEKNMNNKNNNNATTGRREITIFDTDDEEENEYEDEDDDDDEENSEESDYVKGSDEDEEEVSESKQEENSNLVVDNTIEVEDKEEEATTDEIQQECIRIDDTANSSDESRKSAFNTQSTNVVLDSANCTEKIRSGDQTEEEEEECSVNQSEYYESQETDASKNNARQRNSSEYYEAADEIQELKMIYKKLEESSNNDIVSPSPVKPKPVSKLLEYSNNDVDSPIFRKKSVKPNLKVLDDSDPEIVFDTKKQGPDVIQLSDSPETPSTPMRNITNEYNHQKPISGMLALDKSTNKLIKVEQRMLASWSPNYENCSPRTQDRMKLEKIKQKILSKESSQPRKMEILEIKNEPATSFKLASLDINPSKLDKNDLKAQVAQGLNKQQTNRNYSYEQQLRELTDPIIESLENKPEQDQDFNDFLNPKGLKVKLLPHQCYSMQWLKWRESEHPYGGILADDMGLGKTLTILSYLRTTKDVYEKRMLEKLRKNEDEEEEEEDEENELDDRGYLSRHKKKQKNRYREEVTSKRLKTLIVLPASLLHQWQGEIENKFERNSFKVHIYHEANRKKHSYNMEDNDIVFTTYEIVSREVTVPDKEGNVPKSDSPLVNIKWKRIILDEAHRIKNHSTKANKAMCMLKAKYRIAITGTPIHNSLNDLYSLIKFIHFSPLDDFGLWQYLFAGQTPAAIKANKTISEEREKRIGFWLKFLSDYLILRRTKKDKFHGTDKCIVDLPEKRVEEVRFKLNSAENQIYQKIFAESKAKVKDILANQQNKLIGRANGGGGGNFSDVFVYLLRLRQACCHMSLLSEVLDVSELKKDQFEQEGVEGLMQNMTLDEKAAAAAANLEALEDIKNQNLEECLSSKYESSKIGKAISMINDLLTEFPDDKLIVVSQWTSILSIVARRLKKRHIEYCEIKGDVMLFKRNEIVESFNSKSNSDLKVMLLSLTAGGVGLNLVGANRLFLLDIHWNPALEQQCADRIYRVGQKKNVTIYKLLCEETIEERIQQIQTKKIEIAEKVCRSGAESSVAGVPGNTKLSLNDFKLLFQDF